MLKRLLLAVLCISVRLLTGLFISERLVNLYAPQTDPLLVRTPVKDDSAVFDYRQERRPLVLLKMKTGSENK